MNGMKRSLKHSKMAYMTKQKDLFPTSEKTEFIGSPGELFPERTFDEIATYL